MNQVIDRIILRYLRDRLLLIWIVLEIGMRATFECLQFSAMKGLFIWALPWFC